jgi:hypothetical protein
MANPQVEKMHPTEFQFLLQQLPDKDLQRVKYYVQVEYEEWLKKGNRPLTRRIAFSLMKKGYNKAHSFLILRNAPLVI